MMTAIESIRLASLLATRDRLRSRQPATPPPRPPRQPSPEEPSKGFVALRLSEEPGERDPAPALAVTIPFSFVAGGATMPAGAYLLRLLSRASRALVMSSRSDSALRATLSLSTLPGDREGAPRLVFQRRSDGFHVAGLHYQPR